MVLTQKQKDDLHKAILEYLHVNDFQEVAEVFQTKLTVQYDPSEKKKPEEKNILEKKWTSLIRLQKKNQQLSKEMEELKEQIEEIKRGGGGGGGSAGGLLAPRINNQSVSKEDLFNPKLKSQISHHKANITRVCFHKQWAMIASSSEDGSAKIYDADSGELEANLKAHSNVVNSVAFDHQGNLVLTASSDMTLKIWELQQFKCIKTLQGHEHSVSHGEFSLDGNQIISCSRDKTIKLWEVSSGYCKKTIEGHDDWVKYVKYSPSGKKFASCSKDQSIIIWDSSNQQIIQHIENAHENVIEIIAWCGQTLDKSEIIPNTNLNNKPINNIINNGSSIQNSANSLEEEEKSSGSTLSKIKKPIATSSKQQFTEEDHNRYLVSGGRDKNIKLWNTQTGDLLHTFIGNDNWVRGLSFHRYLPYMYSCSDDKSIRVWSMVTGKQIKKIQKAHDHFVTCLDISNNRLQVATGGYDRKVNVWSLEA